MAVMTIRNLDDEVREKLRIRAAHNGRSMEAEVRAILTEAVTSPVERSFVESLVEFGRLVRETGEPVDFPRRSDPPRDPFA